MSIIYNGTTVTKVIYGSTDIKQLNVNGKSVATFKKDYEDYLSASSITIDNFLNKVINTDDVFTDNQASNFIGKTITGITNTYDSASNVDWEIIDYNHDSTTGTFDLMAKLSIKDSKKFRTRGGDSSSGYTYNQNYEYSEIRTWLQSYVNNFSSTNSVLYNHLATMDAVTNFNTNQPTSSLYSSSTADTNRDTTGNNKHTISDKIKLLSGTELGYTSSISSMPYNEGTIYSSKFSSKSSTSADSSMIRYSGSSNSVVSWWTRSRVASSIGSSILIVSTDGGFNNTNVNYSDSIVPVIRVAVNVPEYEQYLTDSISISDFLNHVVNNSNVFTDNRAVSFIGKTITGITNTYNSAYNVDWEIIDYNHDGSSNTFDIMAKKSIKDSVVFYSTGNYNQNYEFSTIRTWILNYANNFSSSNSSLYSHLATMDVVYNFNTNQPNNQAYSNYPADSNRDTTGNNKHTLNDKIKLLSCTELGYTSSASSFMPYNEGSIYSSKFSSKSSTSADSSMIRYSGSSNSATGWWTRSRYANSSNGHSVWSVGTGGQLNNNTTNVSRSFVPAIRLSVI